MKRKRDYGVRVVEDGGDGGVLSRFGVVVPAEGLIGPPEPA